MPAFTGELRHSESQARTEAGTIGTDVSARDGGSVIRGIVDRDPGWTQDLVMLLTIFAGGLFAGVIGWMLGSSVRGTVGDYKVEGFIGAAGFTWAALGSMFQQLRKTSRAFEESRAKTEHALEALRRKNEELRQKLIRSSPCPKGFEISLDEHQKLILARPAEWEPQGGVIFDFKGTASGSDLVPAEFRVYYYPIVKDTDAEAHYDELCRLYQTDSRFHEVTPQRVHVGGEPVPIECLQLLLRGYVAVSFVSDPHTGLRQAKYRFIHKDEFDELAAFTKPVSVPPPGSPAASEPDETREWADEVVLLIVRCCHKQLGRVYSFDLFDNMRDINSSTSKFNRALQSVRFLD